MTTKLPKKDRDRKVIDLILRYRLTTNRAIQKLLLPKLSLNAISKITARLVNGGIISRHPLPPPQTYFRLGRKSATSLGLSVRNTEPLGPQALPTEYAILMYVIGGKVSMRRLIQQEVEQCMPWLPPDLTKQPYCIDEQGVLRLALVDLGGSPRHVVKKTIKAVESRLGITELGQLAKAGKFLAVVLTTSDEKQKAIWKQMNGLTVHNKIRMQVVVIRALSDLLLTQN